MACSYDQVTKTLTITYTDNSTLSQQTCYSDQNVETIKVVGDFKILGETCFGKYTSATEIILSDTIEEFGNNLFHSTKIKSLHIPKSLKKIATTQPFDFCSTLEEFTIDSDHSYFSVHDGVLFSSDGKYLYYYPSGKKNTVYQIPHGTETLFYVCFSMTVYLKHIIVPTTVTIAYTFLYQTYTVKNVTILRCPCDDPISTITFGGQITNAFKQCNIVYKNVTYNESLSSNGKVLTISPMRFCTNSYFGIDFDDTLFMNNEDLQTIIIEDGISRITAQSFLGCTNVKRIVIPKSLEYIEKDAFKGCNLKCNSIIYSEESKKFLLQHFPSSLLYHCIKSCSCRNGNGMMFMLATIINS